MRLLPFLFGFLLFAAACSDSKNDSASDSATACKKPLNPNGDSELAILMREMANWTDSCKVAVLNGTAIPPKPKTMAALHTAQRTDETIDASLFNSMATLYEAQVNAFETADTASVSLYNSMVSGCAGCHKNFCQGPMVRIEKMRIPEIQ